ncbi:N-methyl-L-tryptophan oxidase [Mesobacillus maritimus]|uniref:N-methyl-L-tryptophan oxidase n=1 Tax=Mesobacillus maritimus TaxID=1643336 RepID=UPI00384C5048
MKTHYEVIIVGAGSMGMAAGYYLARQGTEVLLIDAFDPPHSFGSHAGETRLIRHAYGEGREYVPLAIRSQQLWDDLQQQTDETIFAQTGVLGFGLTGSKFITEAVESAKEFDLPLEILNGEQISARWPGITLPSGYSGCYEPTSGVLFSENGIRTYRKLALENGASLLTNTPVTDLEISETINQIYTKEQTFTSNKLIISAGAWNPEMAAKLGLNLPLQPMRQVVGWFEAPDSLYSEDVFPGFFVDMPTGTYYGFPSFQGSGLKLGRHDFGQEVDPNRINREFGIYPQDEDNIRKFLSMYMPHAAGELLEGKVCMYTKTPDEHFIIDQHPQHKNVVIAAGFSGHGFKFASGVGEALAQLVTKGKAEHDLSLFSITRPALLSKSSI